MVVPTQNPNRIEPLTVATKETNARLAPIYTPGPKTPAVVGVLVAVLGGLVPAFAVMPIPPPWGVIASILCGAVATGLAAFFGMKSGGVQGEE